MNKKLLVTFLFLSIVELYSMDKKLNRAFLNALSDAMYSYENSKKHEYPYTEEKREYFKQKALIDIKFARDFQEIIKTNQEIIKNELEIKQLKEEWKQKEETRNNISQEHTQNQEVKKVSQKYYQSFPFFSSKK